MKSNGRKLRREQPFIDALARRDAYVLAAIKELERRIDEIEKRLEIAPRAQGESKF